MGKKFGQKVWAKSMDKNSPQVWAWKCGFLGQRNDRSLHNLLLREPEEGINNDFKIKDLQASPIKIFKIEKLESYSSPKAQTQDQLSRSLSSPAKV